MLWTLGLFLFEAPTARFIFCVAAAGLFRSFHDPVMGEARNEVSRVAVICYR
jgi:hypothetical protein